MVYIVVAYSYSCTPDNAYQVSLVVTSSKRFSVTISTRYGFGPECAVSGAVTALIS